VPLDPDFWNSIFESLPQTYSKLIELGFTYYKRSLKALLKTSFQALLIMEKSQYLKLEMKRISELFSGIMTHMLERGVNWQWNAPEGKFQSEVYDSINGVRIQWEKSRNGSIGRTDILKGGFRRDRFSMGSKWISCRVAGEDENGVHKSLHSFGDKIRLGLGDPQGRVGIFSADYNSQGDFLFSEVGNSSKKKLDVDPNEFYSRSIEENFKELAELIKYRGTVVMSTRFLNGLEDPTIEKELENSKRDTDFEVREKEWGQEVVDTINRGFNAIMIPLIDESAVEESQPGSRKNILALLGQDVIRLLPHNFTDLSDSSRFSQIRNAIHLSLAEYLSSYYISPKMLNSYFVKFAPVPVDGPARFAVHINVWGKDILSGEVAEGQIYRYDDQDYSIRIRGGKTIVAVEPIIKPQLRVEVELPAHIEAPRIVDYMNIEQNVGWEEALDLVTVSIR